MGTVVWPNPQAYAEAIRQPGAIGDVELRYGQLELDDAGRPRAYHGTFTTTFHLRSAASDTAFRCFVRGYDELARRNTAIGELLQYVRTDALCRMKFLARGIRVAGTWWPAVRMDWVAGRDLRAEIAARLGDGDAMLDLAERFREAMRSLRVLGVAHGDVQHGNIIVSGGRVRLIDYDAMYVPALTGLEQVAFGHRNYQHPERPRAPFDSTLDNFSSIVIYTALVALAADPALWERFDEGDNVLFRAQDFAAGARSALFRTLLDSTATHGLAATLLQACRGPIAEVPALDEAIEESSGTMPAAVPAPPPPHPQQLHSRMRLALPDAPNERSPRRRRFDARSSRRRWWRVAGLAALLVAAFAVGFYAYGWAPHRTTTAAKPARRPAAIAQTTPHVHATPRMQSTPRIQPTPHLQAVARVQPTPLVRTTPRPQPTPRPQAAPRAIAPQGTWEIAEANRLVGSMVWAGEAAVAGGGTLVLNAHKVSVAGRAATSCEQQTRLHAAVTVGAVPQTVPFTETNCAGVTSTGQVRVTAFAPDARSFEGTFWENGAPLGGFVATKR